jgi:hypothetical protein
VSTFDYQRLLARLVVDQEFFDRYERDPRSAVHLLGIDPRDAERLCALDVHDLRIFREVVHGSREARFQLIFRELRKHLSDQAWTALFESFQRDIVVRDSKNWADLDLFCTWLDGEYPGSVGAALAHYERLVQQVGGMAPPDAAPGTWLLHPQVALFSCGFELDELLEADTAHVWELGRSGELRHHVLRASTAGDDLEILAVDGPTMAVLRYLQHPRCLQAVRTHVGEDEEAVRLLVDAGLVVAV